LNSTDKFAVSNADVPGSYAVPKSLKAAEENK